MAWEGAGAAAPKDGSTESAAGWAENAAEADAGRASVPRGLTGTALPPNTAAKGESAPCGGEASCLAGEVAAKGEAGTGAVWKGDAACSTGRCGCAGEDSAVGTAKGDVVVAGCTGGFAPAPTAKGLMGKAAAVPGTVPGRVTSGEITLPTSARGGGGPCLLGGSSIPVPATDTSGGADGTACSEGMAAIMNGEALTVAGEPEIGISPPPLEAAIK